jgi:hypothetical protein
LDLKHTPSRYSITQKNKKVKGRNEGFFIKKRKRISKNRWGMYALSFKTRHHVRVEKNTALHTGVFNMGSKKLRKRGVSYTL